MQLAHDVPSAGAPLLGTPACPPPLPAAAVPQAQNSGALMAMEQQVAALQQQRDTAMEEAARRKEEMAAAAQRSTQVGSKGAGRAGCWANLASNVACEVCFQHRSSTDAR